jgi:predicted HicB family RNase H-like nuclease
MEGRNLLDFMINASIFLAFFIFAYHLFGGIIRVRGSIEKLNKYIGDKMENSIVTDAQAVELVNDFFREEEKHPLKGSWQHFFYQAQRTSELPDIFDHINRETITYFICRRKLIEIVPGLLVSSGILGTFLGLKLGLDGFHLNGDASIQGSIGNLIGGVNLAFTSSLIGIFLSVAWTFVDKWFISPSLEKEVDELLNRFNVLFSKTESDVYLKRLVDMQKEQLDAFRTMVTDTLIPNLINGFKEGIQQTIVPQLEQQQESLKRNHLALEKMVDNAAQQQTDSLNTMAQHFLQSLNQATADHFSNLKELLGEMVEWSRTVHEKTSTLIDKVAENTESQTNMGDRLLTLGDRFNNYTQKLTSFQFELNTSLELLHDIEANLNKMQETATVSLEKTMDRHEQLDRVGETLRVTMAEQLKVIDNRMENLKGYWEGSEENMRQLNKELSTSTETFSNNLYQGLERTFQQYDKNLAEALGYLQSSIMGIEDAVEEMPELIDRFQSNLRHLNEAQSQFLQEEKKWRQEVITTQQQMLKAE